MSTSPSWFDQEKFSRLVKKVGPKAGAPGAAPVGLPRTINTRPPEKETHRLQRSFEIAPPPTEPETPVSDQEPAVAEIEPEPVPAPTVPTTAIRALPEDFAAQAADTSASNFPPAIPPPEPRSVSPLARRTTSLPNLKPLFEYEKPQPESAPQAPAENQEPDEEESELDAESALHNIVSPLTGLGEPPEFPGVSEEAPLNIPSDWKFFPTQPGIEDKAEPANEEGLEEIEELLQERDDLSARVEQLTEAATERDEARREVEALRAQLAQATEIRKTGGTSAAQLDEALRLVEERDGARRDYANLREQYEVLKLEQSKVGGNPRESRRLFNPLTAPSTEAVPDREAEVNALKAQIAALETMVAGLKSDAFSVQEQIAKTRDDASVAQRGLALSQRALQETRDALRETSESLSQTKQELAALKKKS